MHAEKPVIMPLLLDSGKKLSEFLFLNTSEYNRLSGWSFAEASPDK